MERRFYIEQGNIKGNSIILEGDEHLHLSKVLRLKVGDLVECFYDNSEVYECKILEITKNYTKVLILNSYNCVCNPTKNVVLFQGLPKQDKLDLIVQKSTELGISLVVPFTSKFCMAKPNENKQDRLNKIIISACKQCKRTKLTKICHHKAFEELLNEIKNFDLVVFANEKEKSLSIKDAFKNLKLCNLNNVALIVGSEGGFSENEIEILNNFDNVVSISLGKRILRTETASITLISIIMHELNEI